MADATTLSPRALRASDLDEVVRIDALHTGERKPAYWRRVFGDFLGAGGGERTFGYGVDNATEGLAGFLLAEVRAFEFGSEPCGWVFAVGIDLDAQRVGLASALLVEALQRFRDLGVETVRTMVRRNDIPVLSFFRANRFVGGPYVQLELELGTAGEHEEVR